MDEQIWVQTHTCIYTVYIYMYISCTFASTYEYLYIYIHIHLFLHCMCAHAKGLKPYFGSRCTKLRSRQQAGHSFCQRMGGPRLPPTGLTVWFCHPFFLDLGLSGFLGLFFSTVSSARIRGLAGICSCWFDFQCPLGSEGFQVHLN